MRVHVQVRDYLAASDAPAGAPTSVRERREASRRSSDELSVRFTEPGPLVGHVAEHDVDVAGGAVRVRVYGPGPESDGRPLHVFFHGGGFWLGSASERVVDATCRERSRGGNCVVVSVDYRLAPEHPFPTAVEDGMTVLRWAHDHAEELGADPDVVSVGGISAGANIAAAVALAVRHDGPSLRLQLLEVPVLDLTLATMRASGVGDEFGLSLAGMEAAAAMYLPTDASASDPLASPLLAPDLGGLPAARILTAEHDPLRDDGLLYARRLAAAGVTALHTRQPGAVHGSLVLTRTWAGARAWRQTVLDALAAAHDLTSTTALN